MREYRQLFAGGRWYEPESSELIDVVDPTSEEVVARVPRGGPSDVRSAAAAARLAFEEWSSWGAQDRAALLREIADGIEARADEIADLMVEELGMPRDQSRRMQAGSGVNAFRMAAQVVEGFQFERPHDDFVARFEPVGVVAAITPWNYPLNQIGAKVAYALAAGCTVALKPSEVVPSAAFVLTEVLADSRLPDGAFNLLTGFGNEVGAGLVEDPDVDMVSFTGSTNAGRQVAAAAAFGVKRVALELGGKSAQILLEGADLADGVAAGVRSSFLNSGQTCSAWTRLLVPRARLGEVEDLARSVVEASVVVGPPGDEGTTLGPVVSRAQLQRVREYILSGIEEGARLVTGGPEHPEGLPRGFFVRPTVFSDVTPEMRIAREEIFGPVLSILPYDTVDDAVDIANGTPYGLSGGVSGDPELAMDVARRMRTGQVRVNGAAPARSAPFGGYRQSGYGREHGVFGLEEFLEVKALIAQ